MTGSIQQVELVPEGVLVVFSDGREALLDPKSLMHCVEQENGFERLALLRSQLRHEAGEPSDSSDTAF